MERDCSINSSEPFDRAVDCGAECVLTLKALAHPIRFAVMIALGRGDLSPSQFARSRGEPVSNVSYHFRLLAEFGLIELARIRPVRGSVEHIYRPVETPDSEELKVTLTNEYQIVVLPADLAPVVAWIAKRCEVGGGGSL